MAVSMAAGGCRVYPIEEMDSAGASAGVSTSNYGSARLPRIMKEDSKTRNEEQASSLEQAYWAGMRKRMGLSRLTKEEEEQSEDRKYERFRRDRAQYVEGNFHQKECMKFVPKPNQKVYSNKALKCHCGEVLSLHWWSRQLKEPGVIERNVPEEYWEIARNPTAKPPADIPQMKWDAEQHITERRSFTYGKMNFNVERTGGNKPAKYLRLSHKDSVDACLEFMEIFWHIMEPQPPNLVISVVGGAKNFRLDGEMRDTFSNGLIKAAKTTNAWLITSGFNMGVMKSVGQAVREGQAFQWNNDRMTHLLRCIAIAPWGYVYNRRFLEGRNRMGKENAYYRSSNIILHGQPVSLNPDHTHFIFVDDGVRNRYGGVADFRARFERKLCAPKTENGYGIPVVMVVVEGGPDAIQDACHSLKQGIPVVVCTGTGRAADFLTYAHKFTFKDRGGERTMNERQRKTLEDRVATAYSKNWGNHAKEELQKVMNNIDDCIERDNLMIFFDLRREEDLDVALLSVLTKAETTSGAKHRLNQLELALTWNRADIAQSEIFREDVNWNADELYQIMTKALQEGKIDFVRLLLNQGVSMKEYLTVRRLENLYNTLPKHGYVHYSLKRYLKKEADYTIQDIGHILEKMLDRFEDDKFHPDHPHGKGLARSRPGSSKRNRGMDTTDTEAEEEPHKFQRPYKQLMIWAVMCNRPNLAKFFWEMGGEPITSALSASLLCLRMYTFVPKYLHSIREDFVKMKKMFEELATKVLDECHAVDPAKAIMLVERKSPAWSRMTCLQIAAAANNQQFVSSVACQNSVNNVWKSGILSDWRQVSICALFPFLVFPLIHVTNMGNKPLSRWQKFQTFLTAPITKFFHHMMSYFLFLVAYSVMVLMDFQKYPSPLEYILVLWILSFLIGEIHTFIVFPSPTFRGKIRDWFTFLNRLEMGNYLLAIIGFALRANANYYTAAKTIYCINAVIFFIRIIKVYIANSHLGPKLYMILRMVEELVMFMVVLVVFLLAYGVCSQGLLYKRREPSLEIVKDIIQFPYWQLYGEIFLEEIESDADCLAKLGNGTAIPPYENTCRESYWLVYIMLGLYLLVGNVLLLNLLIAIFSHVFNMVEQNSIEIWKYQMYFLVMEIESKPIIPPPLSICQHIYFLIRFFAKRSCCKKRKHGGQFSQQQLTYLALFEKEMMANYMRRLKYESMDTTHRRFTKLQKRVDMLNKIIEERHVEDELAMQASLRFSDGLKVLSATVNRRPSMPESDSAPALQPSTMNTLSELLNDQQSTAKEEEEEEAKSDTKVPERESKVTFALDARPGEAEEAGKRRHKKKKKKERRNRSKDRESSPEKKELNINHPETDAKPVREKHISDENNDASDGAIPLPRSRSKSPADSAVFFKRPPPAISITSTLKSAVAESLQVDVGDEPDEESEGDSMPKAPRSPRRPKSRGHLNMLSHGEHRMFGDEEPAESSSDDNYQYRPPPHHRSRKNHRHRPRDERDDSDFM